jgi:hypothetical protein
LGTNEQPENIIIGSKKGNYSMNARRNLKIIKRVLKENQYPVSVIDDQDRVIRYRNEDDALAALGPVKIINYYPSEYFLPKKSLKT